MNNRTSRRQRATLFAVPTVVAVLALAACGGSSSDGGSASLSADETTYVQLAQQVSERATAGPIYAPTNEFTPGEDLKAATEWLGPTSAPAIPNGKSIAFVSCGAEACNESMEFAATLAEKAGFKTDLVNINGSGDVNNLTSAMSSAIALKPSAIVTIAVAGSQVAAQLREAKAQGIITVSTADPTPTGGDGQYDAAADAPNGLGMELLGWSVVADTNGSANVIVVNDKTFPAVERKVGTFSKVIEGCTSCDLTTVDWLVGDAVDPTKAANIITGAINANPDADVIAMPYSVGMPSVIQAVKASGRDIKIYTDDADSVNLAAVTNGQLAKVSAVDFGLVMYQAIDQVIRAMNSQPFTELDKLPFLAMVYDQSTAPSNGVGGFNKFIDYESIYAENWKLNG